MPADQQAPSPGAGATAAPMLRSPATREMVAIGTIVPTDAGDGSPGSPASHECCRRIDEDPALTSVAAAHQLAGRRAGHGRATSSRASGGVTRSAEQQLDQGSGVRAAAAATHAIASVTTAAEWRQVGLKRPDSRGHRYPNSQVAAGGTHSGPHVT